MTSSTKPGILPPLTTAQAKACKSVVLCMDREGRTAIRLRAEGEEVAFIPMSADGLFVTYTTPSVFRTKFPLMNTDEGAPRSLRGATVMSAARCYVVHATYCGAEPRAVEELERLVPVTQHEKERIRDMSTKKPSEKSSNKEKTVSTGKKGTVVKPSAADKGTKAPRSTSGPAGERRASASQTFRELIMRGTLTDDQIFAEVQKRHPEVGNDKRKYVAWYRNDLRKNGENPPAQKKALKE